MCEVGGSHEYSQPVAQMKQFKHDLNRLNRRNKNSHAALERKQYV